MKKLAALLVLFTWCALAFALPSPHQIEDALAARDYVTARGMVQQVLAERPDSARAHLMNAYLLEHVDHNVAAARAELQTASGLDKRGDVKGSALFGRVVAEMDAQPVARAPAARPAAAPAPQPALVAPPAPAPGFPWVRFLVILVLIVLLVWLVMLVTRERQQPQTIVVGGYGSPGVRRRPDPEPTNPGGSPAYAHTPVYEPSLSPVIVQQQAAPARGGMTAGENFASTAGGVVAGNVISDMLLHRHHDNGDDYERRRRRDESSTDLGMPYVPAPSPAPAVDYASERASFSSSSSGSDSWGSSSSSSSSDYSSSSSSDSSWGGSSDSGSSSDW